MVHHRVAVVGELVERQRAVDDAVVGHDLAHQRLEEQLVRHERGAEEGEHVRPARDLHDGLQRRPSQHPPLRAEMRDHVAHEAALQPQPALQPEHPVGELGPFAPVEVPAVLVALALRAALHPFHGVGGHALDELVAAVAVEEALEVGGIADGIVHRAHQVDVVGLPARLGDGLDGVERRLHDRPLAPPDRHAPGEAQAVAEVGEAVAQGREFRVGDLGVVVDDHAVPRRRHGPGDARHQCRSIVRQQHEDDLHPLSPSRLEPVGRPSSGARRGPVDRLGFRNGRVAPTARHTPAPPSRPPAPSCTARRERYTLRWTKRVGSGRGGRWLGPGVAGQPPAPAPLVPR